MGADIHGWVEKRIGDRFVAVRELYGDGELRNYERFAKLAGVRGDGPVPRGLPPDISETVAYHAKNWEMDGHSFSWLPLDEAFEIFKSTATPTPYERGYWDFFHIERHEEPNSRLVFWFDN